MISIVRVLVKLRTIIRNLLHIVSMLALLFPLLTGCEDEEMRHQRQHVASMQKEVTTASRELVAADANARKGWVEAQQSFEQTRSSIVQQQTDARKTVRSRSQGRRPAKKQMRQEVEFRLKSVVERPIGRTGHARPVARRRRSVMMCGFALSEPIAHHLSAVPHAVQGPEVAVAAPLEAHAPMDLG